MKNNPRFASKYSKGVALLETLISIVILAFGLLALAGLQVKLQSSEMESYQRSQAIILLQDMTARINTNRSNAADYISADVIGIGDASPEDCSAIALNSERDICQWSQSLKGAAEKSGASNLGAMIGARGCIEEVSPDPLTIRITVAWQGLSATSAPNFSCAQGEYGDDGYRRVISQVVTIGNLI